MEEEDSADDEGTAEEAARAIVVGLRDMTSPSAVAPPLPATPRLRLRPLAPRSSGTPLPRGVSDCCCCCCCCCCCRWYSSFRLRRRCRGLSWACGADADAAAPPATTLLLRLVAAEAETETDGEDVRRATCIPLRRGVRGRRLDGRLSRPTPEPLGVPLRLSAAVKAFAEALRLAGTSPSSLFSTLGCFAAVESVAASACEWANCACGKSLKRRRSRADGSLRYSFATS